MRVTTDKFLKFSYYIIILLLISYSFVGELVPETKFLKYLALPSFFLFLLLFKETKLVIKPYMYPFLLILAVFYLNAFYYNKQGFLESLFIINAFILFTLPQSNNLHIDFRILSIFTIVLFVGVFLPSANVNLSFDAFVRSETSDVEGGMSFYFGVFATYFLIQRRYFWCILNFIFLVLALKRIVLLAFLVVLILWMLPKRYRQFLMKKYWAIIVNFGYLALTILIATGALDIIVRAYTGLSVGHFTQGRSTIVSLILPYMIEHKETVFFFGTGLGSTVELIKEAFGQLMLLHNDIFKMFYELGFFVFVGFFYLLYSAKNEKQFYIAILLNAVFLTDNALIYTHVLTVYFAMSNNFYIEEKRKKI